MMLSLSTLQLTTLGLAGFASASGSVCNQFPYAEIALFSNLPAVQSFCSSQFPLARCTTTSTSTAYTTVPTTVATVTTVTGTSTVTTVVATATSTVTSSTATITTTTGTDTSTVYTGTTTTTTVISTTTTCTSTAGVAKRSALPELDLTAQPEALGLVHPIPQMAASNHGVSKRWGRWGQWPSSVPAQQTPDGFLGLAPSIASTACSCIETPLPCITSVLSSTATSTTSVTATVSSESTTTTSVTTTSTVYTDTTTVVSVQATTATSLLSTSTVQAVATSSVACLACNDGPLCGKGVPFSIRCGIQPYFIRANSQSTVSATSVQDCANQCGGVYACTGFGFNGNNNTCVLAVNPAGYGIQQYDPLQALGTWTGGPSC